MVAKIRIKNETHHKPGKNLKNARLLTKEIIPASQRGMIFMSLSCQTYTLPVISRIRRQDVNKTTRKAGKFFTK
jgi:hypothetical protein